MVDPTKDTRWKSMRGHIQTDEVHAKDRIDRNIDTPGTVLASVVLHSITPKPGKPNFSKY